MKDRIKKTWLYLLRPEAIILGLAILNLYWMSWRESQIDWPAIDYHGYYSNSHRALLLLVASLGLLLNGWWGLVVALTLSGRVIYVLVFGALLSVSYAHDVPMFSRFALRNWWWGMYEAQPQYIIQIALAAAIFICAAASAVSWASRRNMGDGI